MPCFLAARWLERKRGPWSAIRGREHEAASLRRIGTGSDCSGLPTESVSLWLTNIARQPRLIRRLHSGGAETCGRPTARLPLTKTVVDTGHVLAIGLNRLASRSLPLRVRRILVHRVQRAMGRQPQQ